MNHSKFSPKPAQQASTQNHEQVEALRLQVAELEAHNKKLEQELLVREEAMQSLFSFFQDKGLKVQKI